MFVNSLMDQFKVIISTAQPKNTSSTKQCCANISTKDVRQEFLYIIYTEIVKKDLGLKFPLYEEILFMSL